MDLRNEVKFEKYVRIENLLSSLTQGRKESHQSYADEDVLLSGQAQIWGWHDGGAAYC